MQSNSIYSTFYVSCIQTLTCGHVISQRYGVQMWVKDDSFEKSLLKTSLGVALLLFVWCLYFLFYTDYCCRCLHELTLVL